VFAVESVANPIGSTTLRDEMRRIDPMHTKPSGAQNPHDSGWLVAYTALLKLSEMDLHANRFQRLVLEQQGHAIEDFPFETLNVDLDHVRCRHSSGNQRISPRCPDAYAFLIGRPREVV